MSDRTTRFPKIAPFFLNYGHRNFQELAGMNKFTLPSVSFFLAMGRTRSDIQIYTVVAK